MQSVEFLLQEFKAMKEKDTHPKVVALQFGEFLARELKTVTCITKTALTRVIGGVEYR